MDPLPRLAFSDMGADGEAMERIRARLEAIPAIMEAAKTNLTEGGADFLALARFNVRNPDGIGHGHPFRVTPPAGVIDWYEDLLTRRDWARMMGFLALEEKRNEGLRVLESVATVEEYEARLRRTDRNVRRWLVEENILTLPDDTPDFENFGYNVPFIERAARVTVDIGMQLGEMTVAEAARQMIEGSPWLDEEVARVDAEIYLRRLSGYGLGYTIRNL